MKKTIIPIVLLLCVITLFGCTSTKQSSYTDELQAVLEARGNEDKAFMEEFYNDTIEAHFSGMTPDEIDTQLATIKETSDWTIGYFNDKFGDPTDKPYAAQASTDGTFRNSATDGDILYSYFIADADSFSFEIYEYRDHPVTNKLYANVKTPEGTIYNVDFSGYEKNYRKTLGKRYQAQLSSDGSSDKILASLEMYFEEKGTPIGGYFEILNEVHMPGELKFSANDEFYSEYSFGCDTTYLDIYVCALWMKAGYINDIGWFDILAN